MLGKKTFVPVVVPLKTIEKSTDLKTCGFFYCSPYMSRNNHRGGARNETNETQNACFSMCLLLKEFN